MKKLVSEPGLLLMKFGALSCVFFTTAAIRLKNCLCRILVLVFRCLNFVPCLFRMRRRAQNFPAAEPAEEGEHSL